MPWCPQCRAEYVEGIATCAKCGVALVEELTTAAAPGPLARVTSRLGRVRAFTYAAEAYRLLRRRPALLLLPIAIAGFNAVESGVGSYLAATRTALGRGAARMAEADPRPGGYEALRLRKELAPAALTSRALLLAATTFSNPIPYPTLQGLQTYLWFAAQPDPAQFSNSTSHSAGVGMRLLLALAGILLGALLLGGYYGRLRESTTKAGSTPLSLRLYVSNWYVRFLCYLALLYMVNNAFFLPLLLLGGGSRSAMALYSLMMIVPKWSAQVLAVLLALALVAVAMDDAGFGAALKRGMRTVWRGWPTTFTLLAASAVVCAVLWAASIAFSLLASALLGSSQAPASSLKWVGLGAVYHAALAVLGVWLCLAQFLWYREANPVPAAVVDTGEEAASVSEGE